MSLNTLHSSFVSLRLAFGPYTSPSSRHHDYVFEGFSIRDRETCVIGHSRSLTLDAAKDVIAALFSFQGEPTFDPIPLYDEATLQAYLDPASRFQGREVAYVPHARVRSSREELTAL